MNPGDALFLAMCGVLVGVCAASFILGRYFLPSIDAARIQRKLERAYEKGRKDERDAAHRDNEAWLDRTQAEWDAVIQEHADHAPVATITFPAHDHDVHTFRAEEAEHAVTDAYTKRELADLDYDPTEQQHTAWLHEINPVKDSPAVWVEKDARLPKWQSSGLINRYCGQQYDSPFENHRDIPALYREHHAAHTDWDKVQITVIPDPLLPAIQRLALDIEQAHSDVDSEEDPEHSYWFRTFSQRTDAMALDILAAEDGLAHQAGLT